MKKSLSIVTALALLVVLCVPVSASDIGIAPFYKYIGVMSAGLDIPSNGRANCIATVGCMNENVNVTLTITLQQYKSNTWVDVKSWSASDNGKYILALSEYHYVTSGYKYRAETRVKIYNLTGTLLEEQSMYSSEVSY